MSSDAGATGYIATNNDLYKAFTDYTIFNLITGFGMHHRRMPLMRHHVVGRGIGRKVMGHIAKSLGHAIVNKISSAIAGEGMHKRMTVKRRAPSHRLVAGSYKVTGAGRRRTIRKPRATMTRGYGVRVHKPRTTVRRTIRNPRHTLLGGQRKRVAHRRHFVLI